MREGFRPAVLVRCLAIPVALLALLTPAAWAQEGPTVDLGRYGDPIRFVAPDDVTFTLADGSRYNGTIEVRLGSGGLVVIDELGMDAYVEGLAEMPASWPIEALKAQAVAGRTYAWFELEQGRWRRFGFDVCATTSCQVFHGREVVETPVFGERWAQAVAETSRQVLVWEGEPILARYFSTSGGRTRNNEHVFPSEGPRPYLKGIEDPDDAVSPLHEWRVTFTREQFDDILAQGQQLSAATPVADAEHLTSPGGGSDQVRVTSTDGRVVTVGASDFRAFVSDTAQARYPDEFPQQRDDGRPLPTTLPSSRFDITFGDDNVVFDGRGWGHGVGMGQYGAKGKAERGLAYDEILSAYYAGLSPQEVGGLPELIRVGLTTDAGEFSVTADGPFRVVVGSQPITDRGLGSWAVTTEVQQTMGLLAPSGYGAPLVVAATTTSRREPLSVELITMETVVNKATELSLEVVDPSTGAAIVQRELGIVEAGRHSAQWDLDREDGRAVDPGDYDVRLVAVDEEGVRGGTATTVSVRALPEPSNASAVALMAAAPEPVETPPVWPWGVGVGAVIGLGFGLLLPTRP